MELKPADKKILIALAELDEDEQINRGELAEKTEVSKATISKRTDFLEDAGLINKKTDGSERLMSITDVRETVCRISAKEQNLKKIRETPENGIAYSLTGKEDNQLLSTAYGTLGLSNGFQREVTIQDGEDEVSVTVQKLLNKIVKEFEQERRLGVEQHIENTAGKIIDSYDKIRPVFEKNWEEIRKAIAKGCQETMKFTDIEDGKFQTTNDEIFSAYPDIAVERFKPELVEEIATEDFPSDFKQIEKVSSATPKENLKSMKNGEHQSLFTKDEYQFLMELMEEGIKIVEGDILVTASRNTGEITEIMKKY